MSARVISFLLYLGYQLSTHPNKVKTTEDILNNKTARIFMWTIIGFALFGMIVAGHLVISLLENI